MNVPAPGRDGVARAEPPHKEHQLSPDEAVPATIPMLPTTSPVAIAPSQPVAIAPSQARCPTNVSMTAAAPAEIVNSAPITLKQIDVDLEVQPPRASAMRLAGRLLLIAILSATVVAALFAILYEAKRQAGQSSPPINLLVKPRSGAPLPAIRQYSRDHPNRSADRRARANLKSLSITNRLASITLSPDQSLSYSAWLSKKRITRTPA